MLCRSLILANIRHFKRHPWLLILSVLGIAMGVAVVIAVDLANASALQAFERANQVIKGKTTHHIVGGPKGVDEKVYLELRLKQGVRQSTPIIEAIGKSKDFPAYTFKLIGIDRFTDGAFRNFSSSINLSDENSHNGQSNRTIITRLLTEPFSLLMTKTRAQALSLNIGDSINITFGDRTQVFNLIAYIPQTSVQNISGSHSQGSSVLDDLILTDISTAQESLGLIGRLSRIELIIANDENRLSDMAKIEASLPEGSLLISVQSDNDALAEMSNAFRTNLSAMSLLALMVGAFIIYNGMSFSVVQRRELFSTLRVLGATGEEISRIIYIEALVLGIIGTALGCVLGIILGYGLTDIVTRTMNDLYLSFNHSNMSISSVSLLKGVLLGLVATSVAIILPAAEVRKTRPHIALCRMTIEQRVKKQLPLLVKLGLLIMFIGVLILLIPSHHLALSFIALFLLVIGYSLFVPQIITSSAIRLRHLLGNKIGTKTVMALNSVARSVSRTGIAMVALSIAVATTLGVSIMIESFRGAVTHWIEQSIRADIHISVPRIDEHLTLSKLDPGFIEKLSQLEHVKALSKGRRTILQTHNGEVDLIAFDLPEDDFFAFKFIAGERKKAWQAFNQRAAVIVSEPYAFRHGVSNGDHIQLPTHLGITLFEIVGVYSDYSSERGRVVISREHYQHYWQDDGVSSVGLYLQDGSYEQAVLKELGQIIPADLPLSINSKTAIHQATLKVFDRTFAITDVLRILTVGVAFIGILSALLALQLERAREFAVLRAVGLTPGDLWKLVSLETGFLGAFIGLISLPLGLLLSLVLVHVINRRSFGWSMDIIISSPQLINALMLALLAALLAGLYPAYRMANTPPSLALKAE